MFEQVGTPIWDPQGPIDNPFLLGFMGRTRTRQLDPRSLNDHVRTAWEQFQEAEVRLAAAVAAFDDRDTWKLEGALSATAWLKHRLGINHGHAVLLLKLARGLHDRVELADAVVDGDLSIDKARVILERFTKPRADYAERDVDMLIEHANQLSVNDCKLFMAAWAARVDAEIESHKPDDAPKPNDTDRDPTSELYVSEIADGQVIVNGSLAPVLGETFRTAIELARKLVRGENPDEVPVDNETIEDGTPAKPAGAKEPVEDGPEDDRNRAEERADALELIVRFFLDHNDQIGTSNGNRPDVHVEVNLDVLEERVGGIARTRYSNYGLTINDIHRILCDCNITRIVTAGQSEVLDVGRKTRNIPVALGKAIKRRDRKCRMPGCNVHAQFTEVHHRIHWAKGGTTDLLNCFLLCYRHHRMVHSKHQPWTVQGNANSALTFIAPNGDHYCSAPPGRLC